MHITKATRNEKITMKLNISKPGKSIGIDEIHENSETNWGQIFLLFLEEFLTS